MKKLLLYSVCIFLVIGCNKKEDNLFELEIISNQLSLKQNQSVKNILRYKLTNKSNKIYYFNQFPQSNILSKYHEYLFLNNSCLAITDSKNDSIKAGCGCVYNSPEYSSFLEEKLKPIRDLGYTKNEEIILSSRNFTIHPGETIFFEELVYLPKNKTINCEFDSIKENSFGSIFMFSDTTKLKKAISIPMMETIKENNYVVFHGIIKSKNKIPVRILK